ncbi:hypothetical protein [Halorussus ruber]|uniref:hypothetical protein n=1 Tax=Halorussus ruber TaxID=1126238 RepID=UPI001091DA81|nr:hypothetical protein [Halorussus ruber]
MPPNRQGSDDTDAAEREQHIVDFLHELNTDVLDRQKEQSRGLNEKSAHLIRLLGVILSVYSGAFLVAAKRSLSPSTNVEFGFFINEYVVLSVLFLAAGFLYAVLAYHRTEIASGPSVQYLEDEFSDETTITDAKRDINQKVPNWVSNNETEIEKDHTRLFNCKMCIFFSLGYLLVGTAFVGPIARFDLPTRFGCPLVVLLATYLLYDFVRGRVSE